MGDMNFRPISDPAMVAACINAVEAARSMPIPAEAVWPMVTPPRVKEIAALKIGEAMLVYFGARELVARAPRHRSYRILPKGHGVMIVERVA